MTKCEFVGLSARLFPRFELKKGFLEKAKGPEKKKFSDMIFLSVSKLTWPRVLQSPTSARLFPRFELKKGFLKKARPKIAFG